MTEVTLRGRHVILKMYLKEALDLVFPFPVLLFIDDNLTTGACWIDQHGNKKLYPIQGDPVGIIQELLYCCDFLMKGEELEGGGFVGNLRKYARKLGFPVKEGTKLYFTSLVIYLGEYIFELDDGFTKVHYYNVPLKDTNCQEFKKYEGTITIPLSEFIEDVLKISREFLEKYAPVIEKKITGQGGETGGYGYLWELYREVEGLYKKKFGEDNTSDTN
ncbi:hypothetical protein [Thermococcus sp. Bubb.Bath]|uniref:hypothetical protein n=1 Tax=Thermococcus sp. Bubb.Bath TaxID=1638242 RepID=UPI00143B5068|nr:hypothetical protein [Thermococcus sp. Bubb.Bath]NJF26165.1 hypothetical protein [Thermococcus sp. Bubb.Bath]